MSELQTPPLARALRHEIASIRSHWYWFIVLGVILVVLGVVALGSPVVASLATILVLGWLLLISGVVEAGASFFARDWSGMLITLLSGILAAVVGLMLISNPIEGSIALTVLLTSFLFVGGLFKVAAALTHRIGAWLWVVLSGAIDLLLAVLIWKGLPGTGIEIIGVLLGINLIFRGVFWVMLGLNVRSIPKLPPA